MSGLLLVVSSLVALMTDAPKHIPEGASSLERFRTMLVPARKQPADVYIGSRMK